MNISGYTITRCLGRGGQAVVYEAVQHSLGRRVALKVLDSLYSGNAELSQRFLDEGRILANLGHSNVIVIHDVGIDDSVHYIAMELVEGGSLDQRIREGLAPGEVLDILAVIVDCLSCAHSQYIVHRDIKPANVLFRNDGTVLLCDFGIAKRLDGRERTVVGAAIGTPSYLSPEQARSDTLDGRSDIYSLGVVAYEMFTGRRPFVGDSEAETLRMHVSVPTPVLPDALSRYQPLIDRMMAKDPEARFSDARELLASIDALRMTAAGHSLPGVSRGRPRIVRGAGPKHVSPTRRWTQEDLDDSEDLHGELVPARALVRGDAVHHGVRASAGRMQASFVGAVLGVAFGWFVFSAGETTVATITDAGSDTAVLAGDAKPSVATKTSAPMPAERPAEPRDGAATIDGLLQRARLALNELRLTTPQANNAHHYFNLVLAVDPDNREALDGRRAIVARYAWLARRAMQRDERATAGSMLRRGLSVAPRSAELRALRTELRSMPSVAPVLPSTIEAEVIAVAAADVPRTGHLDEQRLPVIHGESPQQLLARVKSWFQ